LENLADVLTERFSHHQGESGECWHIYSRTLLRIPLGVIGGQRSVTIALPFLSPHQCGPAKVEMSARFFKLKVCIRELSFPFMQEPTEKQPLQYSFLKVEASVTRVLW